MKTELHFSDWLPFLEYGLDMVLRPRPARLLPGKGTWYYAELRSDLRRLKRARLIEAVGREGADRAWQMVRVRARNYAAPNPETRWSRPWDGEWRILVFDLQRQDQGYRSSLWRWLQANRFGMLQYSVWISPDPVNPEARTLQSSQHLKRALQVFQGRSVLGTDLQRVVTTAWDFAALKVLYERVLRHHQEGLELAESETASPRAKRAWLANERHAWEAALFADPLLPTQLHPAGYLGPTALASRKEAYRRLTANGLPGAR